MKLARLIVGIILCIIGGLFVVFEVGMACGETNLFLHGGWVPFSVFVVLGIIIALGGVLLLLKP
jgi:hypothetical protein